MQKFSILLAAIGLIGVLWLPLRSFSQNRSAAQGKSFDPLPDWRPTHDKPGARYVGNTVCAQCHDQGKTQTATPMARALEVSDRNLIFEKYSQLTFKSGSYTYSIVRRDGRNFYVVADGKNTLSVPIHYSFGQGKIAQTYVLEYEGKYYESRVSFYGGTGGLDLTLGAPPEAPASLPAALGRVLDSASLNDCFSCHSTKAVSLGRLQLDKMTPGLTCEGCHGPGGDHAESMKALWQPGNRSAESARAGRRTTDHQILNPGRFDTEGVTQFCGACHRSWIQVQMMGVTGVTNVRFQPYRIFNSKCYDFKDKRISCTACHDPHTALETEPKYYDAKCLACHAADPQIPKPAKHAPACPTAKENCASCHMPKTELPGAHYKFSDHFIRVVRPGEPYPK